jgi:hypothetical protein
MFEMKALGRNADGDPGRAAVNSSGPVPDLSPEQLVPPKSVLRQLFPDMDETQTDWDALGRAAMG